MTGALLKLARRAGQRIRPLVQGAQALAAVAVLACTGADAQERPARQPDTRATYERFLGSERTMQPMLPPASITQRMVKTAEAVKAAPSLKAVQKRLLEIQNKRVSLGDERAASNYADVLAEVSASDNSDFAQVLFWNAVSLDATAFDHTPSLIGGAPRVIEQVGPARSARALAIVHVAMFEALNFPAGKYVTYHGIRNSIAASTGFGTPTDPATVSSRHALAYAAHASLSSLYPSQQSFFDRALLLNLASIHESPGRAAAGTAIGIAAAQAILADRNFDGSEIPEPPASAVASGNPDGWQQDPLNADPDRALGAYWRYVRPFVLTTAEQFRVPAPPAKNTQAYKDAFLEVLSKGGDPAAGPANPPGNTNRRPTPTTRTANEEIVGKFWAYDATPLLCAPPRLYNMVATSLVLSEKSGAFTNAVELARFLAIVNVAMADAGIAAWESKFYYKHPRPVTAIRAATTANSPIPQASPFWTPLGAPVSNGPSGRVNFTPPFPAYPSGHAVFGGTVFQIFRKLWGDAVPFTFVSDEYNGLNSDPGASAPRPRLPQTFASFSEAEEANGQSRIYLGIHWAFDKTQGIDQGRKVADHVLSGLYLEASTP
ncbi:hypothetical protein AYO47_01850 [Planctomyces sp. SCGC AG-212-M04]|nr:hypothetical protein AYO47_01850 [Planctomyces sp. SCGC AG-212-M04]